MNLIERFMKLCGKDEHSNIPKIVVNDPYLEGFSGVIKDRIKRINDLEMELTRDFADLSDFANGHKYFGLRREKDCWIFREWAPNATSVFLIGDFSDWKESETFKLKKIDENGIWEIRLSLDALNHKELYKLIIHWQGGHGERIPSYANYVVQDKKTHIFSACVWGPDEKYVFKNTAPKHSKAPIIYEAHIGMGQEDEKVGTYDEFRENVLPRIKKAGYNTIQIMAIQEHPYYGSFGYQVSSFFAPSSRSGTPCELRRLIDEIHGMGLKVVMDIVHSHAVKNLVEGLSLFDGTSYQYFHEGGRGNHDAWDTKCFNYGKSQVVHFLLSNVKYWMEEFQFDGFRFDGVTSMLYHHRGLGKAFTCYDDYFNNEVDEEALFYLALANKLIHKIDKNAISIAEDVSGMPGLASPFEDGGIGFDYRLSMGLPDFWIKTLKEVRDEDWNVDHIWRELTNRRSDENVIVYSESHDQALVGDKTLIFHLVDSDMYWNFAKDKRNLVVDRGIALHKMIRFITITCGRGGYLNFMGNEFGHPEWIDFPRKGNDWSFHYARRQWSLLDDHNLCYEYLADFDREMINFVSDNDILDKDDPKLVWSHFNDRVLGHERNGLIFMFNFHPDKSYADYMINVDESGEYKIVFHSDEKRFGGFDRLKVGQHYQSFTVEEGGRSKSKLSLYLPARSAMVLKKI